MKTSLKTSLLKATAKKACGAASWWDLYQPNEPEALKKLKNNFKTQN